MSVLDSLTPLERRFLEEALGRAESKPSSEGAEEERRREQGDKQGEASTHNSPLPPVKRKPTRFMPPDAVDRCSQQIRHENALWDQVERSLEFPFVYRSDKNKDLCLKMLRRIPQFESLVEDDLVVIATRMEIVRVRANTVLAGCLPFPPCSSCLAKQAARSASSDTSNEVDGLVSLAESLFGVAEKKEVCEHVSSANRDVNKHVFVLLRGKIALRLPSVQTSLEAFVEPYEVFALPTTVAALPEGSWYVTTGECMLLRLARDTELALDRLISYLEKQVLNERALFLRCQLRVKIFTHWTRDKYEAAARSMIPLRTSWRQMVVTQGMEADALYFIKEGQCVVVRDVPMLHQQTQEQERRPRRSSGSTQAEAYPLPQRISPGRPEGKMHLPATSVDSPLPLSSPPPHTKLVELGTLREGEFFGELGLLNHDVDWRPDVEKVWSETYWHNLLLSALHAPIDYAAVEGNMSWCSTTEYNTDDYSLQSRVSSAKPPDGAFPPASLHRQASVYTKTPCVLYMLTHENCRHLFGEREYAQLKGFAKGYPSCENIEEQYERQRKWAQYRKALVKDVAMESTSFARQLSKLPPLRF
ncbi:uncharacterized protein Tco025E_04162 [Trypanosoma conorhini]|uniref:Cyclic nucleotide-binding domain-containing protein n=1 Tax=Trypanosoma conorhini TaxID=83891 RepID=A0A422PNQ8_9TRYP|nr:uncharacterized protein Tco025E_04162 [Trypanosoma conorhini]RNF19375.1 hypothetical protein Tco025E_04162 [Trypanosoma conorhini]